MTWFDGYHSSVANMWGAEAARHVAASQTAAVDWVEAVCAEEGIDADFRRVDGFLYPLEPAAVKELREELGAARAAGVADVELVDLCGGADVGGVREALRFPRNAEFHPLKGAPLHARLFMLSLPSSLT
jgi:hypothetical protein